jgi:membrane-associated phospholipid phosphatase
MDLSLAGSIAITGLARFAADRLAGLAPTGFAARLAGATIALLADLLFTTIFLTAAFFGAAFFVVTTLVVFLVAATFLTTTFFFAVTFFGVVFFLIVFFFVVAILTSLIFIKFFQRNFPRKLSTLNVKRSTPQGGAREGRSPPQI